MVDLNVMVIGILDKAEPTLRYAQHSIFQNVPLFAAIGKFVKLSKLMNKAYTIIACKSTRFLFNNIHLKEKE